jgi:hypothetical protein
MMALIKIKPREPCFTTIDENVDRTFNHIKWVSNLHFHFYSNTTSKYWKFPTNRERYGISITLMVEPLWNLSSWKYKVIPSTSISNEETVLGENSVSDAKPDSDTEPILDVASSGSNSDS